MSDQLNKLRESQNKIWLRMQEIQGGAEERGEWTAEERANWDAAEADLTAVSGDIERVQRAAKLSEVDYGQVVDARAQVEAPAQRDGAATYEEAFSAYLRGGVASLNGEQRNALMGGLDTENRALAGGTSSAGGYLVPTGFLDKMTETLKAYGGLLQHANVITTDSGQPLPWVTNNDTSNVGSILAENTQISDADPSFGTASLSAYTYTSGLVRIPWQLLQDNAFNLDTWLPPKLGERIGRAFAAHFVSGTGSSQPTGLIASQTAAVTGTGTTAISFDNLVDLEHSVDPAYRQSPNARYVLSDGALKTIRKLKDGDGRPLWVPTPAPGFPATINGFAYTVDNSMAAPGASAKTIGFGDIKAAYVVRMVKGVTVVRMSERYADYLQDGLFGYARMDARPDDTSAFKVFAHAAS